MEGADRDLAWAFRRDGWLRPELSGAKKTDKKTLAMFAQVDGAEALRRRRAAVWGRFRRT